jgi:protease I
MTPPLKRQTPLRNRTIVVLAHRGYQELEFWYPALRGREDGATVLIVAAGAEPNESFLGYPVLGDCDAADVDAARVDAVIVPGAVAGAPQLSPAQRDIIVAAHAAGRAVYASGSAVALVAELVDTPFLGERVVRDADVLPDLWRRLSAELAPAAG